MSGSTDAVVAREIASAAGALLLEIRVGLDRGVAAEEVRREGDRLSNELILARLKQAFPDDAVLSEESEPPNGAADPARLWIVDPLDGTREFGEPGRSDWAVHVALVENGRLVAGAVTLPAAEGCFASDDAAEPAVPARNTLRIAVSRTRPPAEAVALADELDGELVPMGSAGAKTVAVLTGEVDVYVHSGGQYAWDSAAPVAVATAAGLHASRIDGSALDYSPGNVWQPDLVVCRPELRRDVLAALCDL